MIRHVVAFRLKAEDAADRARDAASIQQQLTSLVGLVPELRHLEVGIDVGLVAGHWDVCLVTDFDSVADLENYQGHADHVRVVTTINPLIASRAVVDYET